MRKLKHRKENNFSKVILKYSFTNALFFSLLLVRCYFLQATFPLVILSGPFCALLLAKGLSNSSIFKRLNKQAQLCKLKCVLESRSGCGLQKSDSNCCLHGSLCFCVLESENPGQGWGNVERPKGLLGGARATLGVLARRLMELWRTRADIRLGDCPGCSLNKQYFSNWRLPVHSCGCLGAAQENVFTALGDCVMRITCKLNVQGATPGTYLNHGGSSHGKMFWDLNRFMKRCPSKPA